MQILESYIPGRRLALYSAICLLSFCLLGCGGFSRTAEQSIVGPRVLFNPSPIYPHDHDVDGAVVLSGYVGTDGKFHDPKVVTSLDPTLDDLAVEAVGRWKFKPATRDGVPVDFPEYIRVKFKLAP